MATLREKYTEIMGTGRKVESFLVDGGGFLAKIRDVGEDYIEIDCFDDENVDDEGEYNRVAHNLLPFSVVQIVSLWSVEVDRDRIKRMMGK